MRPHTHNDFNTTDYKEHHDAIQSGSDSFLHTDTHTHSRPSLTWGGAATSKSGKSQPLSNLGVMCKIEKSMRLRRVGRFDIMEQEGQHYW